MNILLLYSANPFELWDKKTKTTSTKHYITGPFNFNSDFITVGTLYTKNNYPLKKDILEIKNEKWITKLCIHLSTQK